MICFYNKLLSYNSINKSCNIASEDSILLVGNKEKLGKLIKGVFVWVCAQEI